MKRRLGMIISLVAVVFLLVSSAAAAPKVPLKIEKVEVQTYSALYVQKFAGNYGQREVLSAPGKVFLSITLLINPQWRENTKRFQVNGRQITLSIGGAKLTMVGSTKYPGVLETFIRSLYLSRPYRWPNTVRKESYNAVYLVPQGTTSAVLHLGDTTVPIKVPAQVQGLPNQADGVKVAVLGVREVPGIKRLVRAGSQELHSDITLPLSRILEVRIRFSILKPNQVTSPNSFSWSTRWFGILYPGGAAAPCLGELGRKGTIHDNMIHGRTITPGRPRVEELTMYFAAPAGVKSFKLLYLNQPVAQGSVGGAAATPPPKDASAPPAAGPKKGGLLRRIMGR